MLFAWILQNTEPDSADVNSDTTEGQNNCGPEGSPYEPVILDTTGGEEEEEEQDRGDWEVQENDDEKEEEELEITAEMLKRSSFLQEYANLEAYVRQLYHEIKPADKKFYGSMRQLIDLFSDLEVLPKGWHNSYRMRSITEACNKLSHGIEIGVDEIDVIQNSAKNISMVRGEINDAFVLLVIKLHFHNWKVEKTTKGGFDILAESPKYHLAVEVKNPVRGGLDDRTINELIDKYSNYITINSHQLYFLVIYFQPPGRKSFDDFFVKFNERVKEQLPEYENL